MRIYFISRGSGFFSRADPKEVILMSKLETTLSNSNVIVFTMKYKPDFPIEFFFGGNPFSEEKNALFADIVHPDDYRPFCEIIGDIVNRRADKLSAHVRMMCGGAYHWYYISATPEFKEDGRLSEINGIMYDVTVYLDCSDDDLVMRELKNRSKAAFDMAENTPHLLDVLGEDYLKRIQQPLSLIDGLYSVIIDENGTAICPPGQNKGTNLNKMSYQRKKSIRIKHQNVGTWLIASESPDSINSCVPLLDTMVQTVSELANSYIVISEEMENSQKANKLLGQNFEDQILINNIYTLILKSRDTSASFGSIVPLIKEYFGLSDLMFCYDAQRPVKVYRWDEGGTIIPMIANEYLNEKIDKELENDAVVCLHESEFKKVDGLNRSCALSRVYENGSSRGIIMFISDDVDRVWTNRDRKLIKSITQIMSTIIYRSFMENDLAVSQEHLLRLAYYNTTTGIPNRSAFERDFRSTISEGKSGAVVSIEIANLKSLSEIYSCRYADEVTRSIAEYISAIRTDSEKHIYLFSNDILFVSMLNATRDEAVSLAQSILFKFRSPWYLNDNENKLDIYAGVCVFPEDADCVPDCVRVATKTLRLAKDRKLHDAVCYSNDLEEKLDDNQRVKKLITDAVENDFKGFYYLYTPVLDVSTGELTACEAHLFWGNGDIIVSRDRFLPIIDRMGAAFTFHNYALGRLCELASEVRKSGVSDFKVAYTIPENVLNSENCLLILKEKLLQYSLSPDAIAINISQSDHTLLSSSSNLKMLSKLGVTVIADDKGENFFTGEFLDNPYINIVKLRARRLNDDPVSAPFVRSLITRAHDKGIKVCVKGVDNQRSLDYARRFGADTYQGIYNCRPLHTKEFIKKMVIQTPAE